MRVKMKPILPKRPIFDVVALEQAVEKSLDDAAKYALDLFEKTTATWETNVKFTITKTKSGRSIGTRSTIYKFVDEGTRPHKIVARNADALVFQYGEARRAKTKPKVISSYKGALGDQWASKKEVNHPGTAPREFTKTIGERAGTRLRGNIRRNLSSKRIG